MSKTKKKIKVELLLVCCMCILYMLVPLSKVSAQMANWKINQSLNVASGQAEDVVELSVYLQGGVGSIQLSQLNVSMEFDTSVFSMQQIVGDGLSTAKVDDKLGTFTLANGMGKVCSSGDLLFTVMLKVNKGVSAGKTSVCVTEAVLKDVAGKENQISNFVPLSFNILEEGVTEIKKSYQEEVFEEVSKYNTLKNEDNSKMEETASSTKKTLKAASVKTQKKATSETSEQLDANYKTDAGFGNDIYFIVSAIMGICVIGLVFLQRKTLKS